MAIVVTLWKATYWRSGGRPGQAPKKLRVCGWCGADSDGCQGVTSRGCVDWLGSSRGSRWEQALCSECWKGAGSYVRKREDGLTRREALSALRRSGEIPLCRRAGG